MSEPLYVTESFSIPDVGPPTPEKPDRPARWSKHDYAAHARAFQRMWMRARDAAAELIGEDAVILLGGEGQFVNAAMPTSEMHRTATGWALLTLEPDAFRIRIEAGDGRAPWEKEEPAA